MEYLPYEARSALTQLSALGGGALLLALAALNVVTFLVYGWDKLCAKREGARRVPEKTAARLEQLLTRLGLPNREGRAFLNKAILCAWQDGRLLQALTKRLYPMVAECFGVDAKKVERDMRRTIEYAWKYGAIDEQYAIFGGTIDAQRGKPTCGEMIAQLADILRLEG